MNPLRRFLAAIDIRELMFFAMMLAMPAIGGFAGAWLAFWMTGGCL